MIATQWSRCRDWLLPAIVDATEAEIVAEIEAGRAQLWAGERCALVTQLMKPPPLLHIWIGGGDLAELKSLFPGLAAWARSQGAESITINGRRGWKRVLAPLGFAPDGEELRKALR